MNTPPVRHQSVTNPQLHYWAELVEPDKPGVYCIVGQVTGFPPTEAWDDWFANHSDADNVAAALATGTL